MGCSPPGSSVLGVLQARILEWVAVLLSRGFSQPRDQTQVSCIADRFFFFDHLSHHRMVWRFLNQPKRDLLQELRCHPWPVIRKETCTTSFTEAYFTISEMWEQS